MKTRSMLLFIFLVLTIGSFSYANINKLDEHYYFSIGQIQRSVVKKVNDRAISINQCGDLWPQILEDRQITIFVGFGYMDVSTGSDYVDTEKRYYGKGHVLDSYAQKAFEDKLTTPCVNYSNKDQSLFCGFRRLKKNKYTRRVDNRFGSGKFKVIINTVSSSTSALDRKNRNTKKQAKKSQAAEKSFLRSLRSHDVVLYVGHARGGGGPDFSPPVFISGTERVNYPHYQAQRSGINKVLQQLNSPGAAPVVGLLACKSTQWVNSLRNVAPASKFITASDLFDYNDIIPTAYTVIEAVLNQQCGSDFNQIIKKASSSPQHLNIKGGSL